MRVLKASGNGYNVESDVGLITWTVDTAIAPFNGAATSAQLMTWTGAALIGGIILGHLCGSKIPLINRMSKSTAKNSEIIGG